METLRIICQVLSIVLFCIASWSGLKEEYAKGAYFMGFSIWMWMR